MDTEPIFANWLVGLWVLIVLLSGVHLTLILTGYGDKPTVKEGNGACFIECEEDENPACTIDCQRVEFYWVEGEGE